MSRAFFVVLPMVVLSSVISFAAPDTSRMVGIADVLSFARAKGAEFKAIELELRALEEDIESREEVLSPSLTSSISRTWDRRETLTSAAATRQKSSLISVELEKPFPTGTAVGVLADYEWAQSPRTNPNLNTVIEWQVYASQSLWRDAFGEETRARQRADSWEKREREFTNLLNAQNYLMEIENAYWTWVFNEKERSIRQANLERSRRIESWVLRRLRLSAAETTDLLQARSLVETRKLQIKTIENKIRIVVAQFESNLPGLTIRDFAPNLSEFSQARQLDSLILGEEPSAEVVSLQSLIQAAKAARQENRAEQERSATNPELEFSLKHGRNGIDGIASEARAEAFRGKNRYSEVSLSLSSSLDFSRMRASARAAKLQAEAEAIRADRLKVESSVDWIDLNREAKSLRDQIETARSLAKIQQQKADAERDRLEKGRSTAFQAITFEQEAAEAELRVWEFELALRKLEARARVFGRFGGRS